MWMARNHAPWGIPNFMAANKNGKNGFQTSQRHRDGAQNGFRAWCWKSHVTHMAPCSALKEITKCNISSLDFNDFYFDAFNPRDIFH